MGNYSYQIDASITEVSYAEPVTLAEAKLYIRVSHSSEDPQISEMISAARKTIEQAAGISIITKQVIVWFSNKGGVFNLPYGPIISTPVISDVTTGTTYDATVIGGSHPIVTFPMQDNMKAVYNVGMTTVPVALKYAILDQLNHMYENRGAGAEGMGICEKAWRACQLFTKQSPIL